MARSYRCNTHCPKNKTRLSAGFLWLKQGAIFKYRK